MSAVIPFRQRGARAQNWPVRRVVSIYGHHRPGDGLLVWDVLLEDVEFDPRDRMNFRTLAFEVLACGYLDEQEAEDFAEGYTQGAEH